MHYYITLSIFGKLRHYKFPKDGESGEEVWEKGGEGGGESKSTICINQLARVHTSFLSRVIRWNATYLGLQIASII